MQSRMDLGKFADLKYISHEALEPRLLEPIPD
jgi:hypothetical protein